MWLKKFVLLIEGGCVVIISSITYRAQNQMPKEMLSFFNT